VCGELVWGQTEIASLGKSWQLPDLVVAADVVYMRELFQPLIASLSALGVPLARLLQFLGVVLLFCVHSVPRCRAGRDGHLGKGGRET
jgi:hypothetical protein